MFQYFDGENWILLDDPILVQHLLICIHVDELKKRVQELEEVQLKDDHYLQN